MRKIPFEFLLRLVLWLIAIHSICYGIGLIIFPSSVFAFFGFTLPQKFFADQGGVFHLIISAVYILAALDLPNASRMIFLTCFTKFSATIFLFAWYFFGLQSWIILVSGIGDFSMGLAVLLLYTGYKRYFIYPTT